jgi:hypothetical protein
VNAGTLKCSAEMEPFVAIYAKPQPRDPTCNYIRHCTRKQTRSGRTKPHLQDIPLIISCLIVGYKSPTTDDRLTR